MTCASCAAHIERTLVDHPGVVRAGVNFATNRASVLADPRAVSSEDLSAAIEAIGYRLIPRPGDSAGAGHDQTEASERGEEAGRLRQGPGARAFGASVIAPGQGAPRPTS